MHVERRAPLAVTAVEDENAVAPLQTQYSGEIVGLGAVEGDNRALSERCLDVKTGLRKS